MNASTLYEVENSYRSYMLNCSGDNLLWDLIGGSRKKVGILVIISWYITKLSWNF